MPEAARRGFWPLRDLPVLLWLVLLAASTGLHPFLPAPRWLMIHLLLLGAVSHSILVWSRHFAEAMLHTAPRPGDRRAQSARLVLLNAGVVAVLGGVLGAWWPLTVAGASAVVAAVGWHGVALLTMMRRALPSRFGATVRYYVAAAALLPVGAVLGTLLARGIGDGWHDRLVLAHAAVNLLGWVGLTVLGTLVTLWPTILRTRIADGAERQSRRAWPVLLGSVLVLVVAAVADLRWGVVLGLVGYLVGVLITGRALVMTARTKPPDSYAGLSVAAALVWLVGGLVALTVSVATAPDWITASGRFDWLVPYLVAGFVAQVLLGALSYLIPVSLGGGPTPVRLASRRLDAGGWLRITVINGGLVLCILPVPSVVRVIGSAAVLAAFAAFVVLLLGALRVSRRAKADASRLRAPRRPSGPASPVPGRRSGMVAVGLSVLVLAVAGGVAVDPAVLADRADAADSGVASTGETTTVTVTARDMRFTPARVVVPAGNRLVLEVINADDSEVHDLVLESGESSGRLTPGSRGEVEVPVVGRSLDGWCSVVGHRQMGMVLEVVVTGGPADAEPDEDQPHDHEAGTAPVIDFGAEPAADFVAHDPVLPPVEGTVHRETFTVEEVVAEVAPGVTQRLWTFNGSMPGPTLHGAIGDVFEITLVNNGSMGHSIDFHAGSVAPDEVMRTIPPGESLVYRFTAERAGIWMFHCSTMPMSAHIANGMFGAVVIDPPDLPEVDREYVLLQSEVYLGPEGEPVDVDKVAAETPDAVVFNGYVNQYDHRPLQARAGERVRIWVLDVGPNRSTSFHVVGGQFDTVYAEGSHLLTPGGGGSQALHLGPAQGGFVELAMDESGHYPLVSHLMVDAERGAHGILEVTD